MDRDNRWDRIREAYRLYTQAEGVRADDPEAALQGAYQKGETDEFVRPVFLLDAEGPRRGTVADGDGIVFFNFRADRAREITRAFTQKDFDPFPRERQPERLSYVCMTLYDETFDLPVAFLPVYLEDVVGAVVSERGRVQLRIAETEKYAHVTYFLNGGREEPFPGEERRLIPSPREVPTYDQKPEMSAPEVTEEALDRIRSGRYDLVVLNFANMDMGGHTGDLEAAVNAVETVDGCVEKIVTLMRERGETLLITADHGNAEQMVDEKGGPHTAHTTNAVPLILVDDRFRGATLRSGGKLGDIAPTILELMKIPQPESMTGISLLVS
jgi:2,3-bisphosphoglycerate-independent phosphoglycerate mutase